MQLKMKELESRTGVSRETIRFYIKEGLLPEPERPRKNVAFYSEGHVTRIQMIKRLQDEHFLPLKKVKAVLDSREAESILAQDERPGLSFFLPSLLNDTPPGPGQTLAELANNSGFTEADIRELAAVGVIEISGNDEIDYRDVAIVDLWAQARDRGFDSPHGYDSSFLAEYVRITRQLADTEASQFMRELGNDMDGRSAAEMGAEGIELANRIISLLHTKFLVEALTRG